MPPARAGVSAEAFLSREFSLKRQPDEPFKTPLSFITVQQSVSYVAPMWLGASAWRSWLCSLSMCTRCSLPSARRLGAPPVASASSRAARYVDSIDEAAEALSAGRLVAFPTETVYGLGANAFDEAAVLAVFAAKGRPRTDPLIVHVADGHAAEELLSLLPAERLLLRRLAAEFWPGPLTLVAPACDALPDAVTGGGLAVGVRCPDHGRALELLRAASVPVAAPSANRFGHVSPTRPEHVMADLGGVEGLLILTADEHGSCSVGIESTVLKLERETSSLILLRRGGVPEATLHAWLEEHGDGFILKQKAPTTVADPKPAEADATAERQTPPAERQKPTAAEALAAPGMRLTHYAPDLPSYLVRLEGGELSARVPAAADTSMPLPEAQLLSDGIWDDEIQISNAVVVDFGGSAAALKARVSAYRDLSPAADAAEAAAALFDALRWATDTLEPYHHPYHLPYPLAHTPTLPPLTHPPSSGGPRPKRMRVHESCFSRSSDEATLSATAPRCLRSQIGCSAQPRGARSKSKYSAVM